MTYKSLRFIGGFASGQTHPVPNDKNTAIRNEIVSDITEARGFPGIVRAESRQLERAYHRTEVTIKQPSFTYTEEVMLLARTPMYEAQRLVLSLGLPKVDLPTMKPLALRPSSAVRSAAYCERTGTLDVSLAGGTYRYNNVAKNIVFDFVTSESLGAFYGANIRNKFDCVRLA